MVEILPKRALPDGGLEIGIGRTDDPDIQGLGGGGPQSPDRLLLELL